MSNIFIEFVLSFNVFIEFILFYRFNFEEVSFTGIYRGVGKMIGEPNQFGKNSQQNEL